MKHLLITLILVLIPHLSIAQKPNILVVIADDLDWATYNVTPGLSAIAAQGMTFNAITSTPLCGPSRASILSGKYTHNHGIKGNDKERYNDLWYTNIIGKTFGDWCEASGYHSVMIGKYANPFDKYNHSGWGSWVTPDGRGEPLPESGEFWHDAMVNRAINEINENNDKPNVVWYSSTIPHGPLIPSPEYNGSPAGLTAPQGPSFNEADVTDKVGETRLLPLMTADDIALVNRRFRLRAEMMRSVVDGIEQLSAALSNRPLYVIFISDNGYLQGAHRFKQGKGQPYEESVRVPMFITGPGVQAGAVSPALVYAADIAPTVGQLCQATTPQVDGKSLVPLFNDPNLFWRNRALLEHGWKGILTPTRKLVRFENGGYELYRFATDPAEMQSQNATVPSLETYMNRLLVCSGADCWNIERE